MDDSDLTADLDPDEPQWPERMVGRLECLLQSDFIDSEDARADFEYLLNIMREISAWKKSQA